MRRTIGILAVIAATAASAAVAAPARHAAQKPQVSLRSTPLGSILVDARGRTLYFLDSDPVGKSRCAGACAANWPPLVAKAAPRAGRGVKQSLLKTVRRADGRLQVVYSGHALYFFSGDHAAGDTHGEGLTAFGGTWFVVNARGERIAPPATGGDTTPAPPGGGYGGGGDGY